MPSLPLSRSRPRNLAISTLVEAFVHHQPYIIESARASYRQWWTRQLQTCALDAAYQPLYPPHKQWRRYHYDRTRWSTVSHTTTLPDGSEVTWSWLAIHGTHYRYEMDSFREGHTKGVKQGRGRARDSFNRKEKTLDFRRNDKTTTRWPQSNSAKRLAQIEDNRAARRQSRQELKKANQAGGWERDRWDGICNWKDPRDTWRWD